MASWAVQEGIGQKTLDRLLSIPGVGPATFFSVPFFNGHANLVLPPMQVVEHLGLSYHNARKLHQIIDNIPPHAEWQTRSLWFRSDPDAKHYIHYRNPLDAIQLLLGNPAHTKHIVYKPKKVFVNARKEKRIYHEMWTGRWWNTVQVWNNIFSLFVAYLVISAKFA